MINDLENFKKEGFARFNKLLDENKCKKLYDDLKSNRNWGPDLFQSEENFNNEFKDKPIIKTNPGKDVQNLIMNHDLDFIENSETIRNMLNLVLGSNYEIMLAKFVVSVSESWMPEYVKQRNKIKLISNFNPYIKKDYRDVTYFRGIDYHMDSIDWENQENQFITMYIYLNDVDKSMSPLNIISGSHVYGHCSFPHLIKDNPDENFLEFSSGDNVYERFSKQTLIGSKGTVFIWTSNTLHGTAPSSEEKENFRISLRYLIKKNKNSSGLIDHCVKQKIVGKTRKELKNYKRILT